MFDDFGWLVCGWSATWDPALRSALQRCPARRFSTYWTNVGGLSSEAESLIAHRKAVKLQIQGADSFFDELKEKVLALERSIVRHPASSDILASRVKRYLPDQKNQIRLHDLIRDETDRVLEATSREHFSWSKTVSAEPEDLRERVNAFVAASEGLVQACAHGGRWGDMWTFPIWKDAIERIGKRPYPHRGGSEFWASYARLPAQLAWYAAGIAALIGQQWRLLGGLFTEPAVHEYRYNTVPAVFGLGGFRVLKEAHRLESGSAYTPASEFLHTTFKEPLSPYCPSEADYDRAFDEFEYWMCLLHADMAEEIQFAGDPPVGRFAWRRLQDSDKSHLRLEKQIEEFGNDLPLVSHGWFGGHLPRLQTAKKKIDDYVISRQWR